MSICPNTHVTGQSWNTTDIKNLDLLKNKVAFQLALGLESVNGGFQ